MSVRLASSRYLRLIAKTELYIVGFPWKRLLDIVYAFSRPCSYFLNYIFSLRRNFHFWQINECVTRMAVAGITVTLRFLATVTAIVSWWGCLPHVTHACAAWSLTASELVCRSWDAWITLASRIRASSNVEYFFSFHVSVSLSKKLFKCLHWWALQRIPIPTLFNELLEFHWNRVILTLGWSSYVV